MANAKKRCTYCKEYLPTEEMVKLPAGYFCNIDHAKDYALKRSQALKVKRERKQHKEDKFRVKTYAQKLSYLQDIFNEMRRLEEFVWFKERGIEPYCISCLKPLGNDQWCCGHFKTRGAKRQLSFDRNNTFLQHNKRCNKELSGDIEGYKKGLVYRFGEQKGKEIINYCESHHESKKYTDEEIKELAKQWRKRIRELKKILE